MVPIIFCNLFSIIIWDFERCRICFKIMFNICHGRITFFLNCDLVIFTQTLVCFRCKVAKSARLCTYSVCHLTIAASLHRKHTALYVQRLCSFASSKAHGSVRTSALQLRFIESTRLCTYSVCHLTIAACFIESCHCLISLEGT